MGSFVHSSSTTVVTLEDGKIHKKFIGEEAQLRFEKELMFLKNYQSEFLPKLHDFNTDSFELVLGVLKSETPGFLDNTEASLLKLEDFQRIRNALFKIQKLNKRLIIHGDLAPHNIYLTDKRVVIADWDQHFTVDKSKYRMYDYATLWSLLDTNEEYLTKIFRQEFENLLKAKLFDDFKFCYLKRIGFLKKYPKQFKHGKHLRKSILQFLK